MTTDALGRRVLGVLAGSDMPDDQFINWVHSADLILAADGGANRLLDCGVVPHTTIGDLDSISPDASKRQVRLIENEDQDTSDCDKLLHFAKDLGVEEITLLGVEGDLLDHVIGTVQSAAKVELGVRLALRRGIAWVLKGPTEFSLPVLPGTRLSLLPITLCESVTITGTQWELSGDTLDPKGLTSLSNKVVAHDFNASLKAGAALLFVETEGTPQWAKE